MTETGCTHVRRRLDGAPDYSFIKVSVNILIATISVSTISNQVRVFAASNGYHLDTLSVSGRPTDIVVLPVGMTAYVAQSDTNTVAVLSL